MIYIHSVLDFLPSRLNYEPSLYLGEGINPIKLKGGIKK